MSRRFYRNYRNYKNKRKSNAGLYVIMFLLFMSKPEVFGPLYLGLYVLYKIVQHYKNRIPEEQQEELHLDDDWDKSVRLPYKKKTFLMTKTEYNFDKVLKEAVGDKYEIERQVPLSKIVEETTDNYTDYKTGRWFNPDRSKIDKKTLDFVLFNKAGYTTHLAIELDDPSHEREDRKERDSFVENVLSQTGIKLLRIKASYNYNVQEITELIK